MIDEEKSLIQSTIHKLAFSVAREDTFLHGLFLQDFLCIVLYHETRIIILEDDKSEEEGHQKTIFDYHTKGRCILKHVEAVNHRGEEKDERSLSSYGFITVFEYAEENVERWYVFDMEKLGFIHLGEFERKEALYTSTHRGHLNAICGYAKDMEGTRIQVMYLVIANKNEHLRWFIHIRHQNRMQLMAKQALEYNVDSIDSDWIMDNLVSLMSDNEGHVVGYQLDMDGNIHRMTLGKEKNLLTKPLLIFTRLNHGMALICHSDVNQSYVTVYQSDMKKQSMELINQIDVRGHVIYLVFAAYSQSMYIAYVTEDHQLTEIEIKSDGDHKTLGQYLLEEERIDHTLCDMNLSSDGQLRLLTTKEVVWTRLHTASSSSEFEPYPIWIAGYGFPYSSNDIQDIYERKRTLNGLLFFDRLMKILDISGMK
jgi:hypothetical protein